MSLFKKRILNNDLISKEFQRHLVNCNDLIDKEFNLIVNRRGKVSMIFIGSPWMIEDYFSNESIKSSPSQKRLIFITKKQDGFEKRDKVSLINSKLNNFLLIKNSLNSIYEVVYKAKSHNKKLWLSEKYDDINKLNSSCLLYTSPSPRDLSTSRMPSSA